MKPKILVPICDGGGQRTYGHYFKASSNEINEEENTNKLTTFE